MEELERSSDQTRRAECVVRRTEVPLLSSSTDTCRARLIEQEGVKRNHIYSPEPFLTGPDRDE